MSMRATPYRFLPEGFWMSSIAAHMEPAKPLKDDVHADVVVIGGGFTGLSAAIALAERGKRVALLERGRVGSGASGYNCGQVALDLGLDAEITRFYLGEERTRGYADFLKRAIANVGTMVARSGADCDYRDNGNLTAAVHSSQRDGLSKRQELFARYGLPATMKSRSELDDMGIPQFVTAAFHEGIGGTIHPAKFAHALAAIARELGVSIYENSPVKDLDLGDIVFARTPTGASVRADAAVIATNAYSAELGLFANSYLPLSVSVIVTQRLTEEQRRRIAWHDAHGMHTQHKIIENIRLTPDGRVLIGTKRVQSGWGNRYPDPQNPVIFEALRKVLRTRLPQLDDVEPEFGWTGRVALSTDTLPFFEYVSGRKNVVCGMAYGGHGIALSSYLGRTLARMLCGDSIEDADVFRTRKRLRILGKPLRWLTGKVVHRSLEASDAFVDRRVAQATRA